MKPKTCKQCKAPRGHDLMTSLCKSCYFEKQCKNKAQTRIKQVSTTNKNTPAKFTSTTKELITDRDKTCILCGDIGTQWHHAYFGAGANRGPDRNEANQGVLLCEACHYSIHHGADGQGKKKRLECIEYLAKLKSN